MEYLYRFKIPSHKILTNYKGKKESFTQEKPGRYLLNQVINENITNIRTSQSHAHLIGYSETHIAFPC